MNLVVKYVLIILLAVFAERFYRFKKLLEPYHTIKLNDEFCVLKGESLGNEDVALGKHSILLFAASGSLFTCFNEGAANAEPGGVWMMDMKDEKSEPKQLKIKNYPHSRFHGHGIYISNQTDRLYVVNHQGPQSVVDVMKIDYNPVKLTYLKTVQSDLFPRYGINDVVEGVDENEIYVSRWQIFPFPENGRKNPDTLLEKIQLKLSLIFNIFGLRLCEVYRCDLIKNTCEVAIDNFKMANGMTINSDRTMVYVSDPVARTVSVLRREASGLLVQEEVIDLPYPVDNLEMDHQTGEILMGTLPDVGSAIESENGGKGISVPGGFSVLKKSPEGVWQISDVLIHDGQLMAQVSAGARFGRRIVMGSPFSKGILDCTL